VLGDLEIGATLSIYVGFEKQRLLIGQATVDKTVQEFDLPPVLPDLPGGPASYLEVIQERCNVSHSNKNFEMIQPLKSQPTAPYLPTMVECARVIHIRSLHPGTTLRIASDHAQWPTLSTPIVATAQEMNIALYRPLLAGETVIATVTGCGAGPGTVTKGKVLAMTPLDPPKVYGPIRAWMSSVKVGVKMPGSHVHVFVNRGLAWAR
jgi:hypothetical protein